MKLTSQLLLINSLSTIRTGKGAAQLKPARGFGATSARPGTKAPTAKNPAPELVHEHKMVSPVSKIASSAAQIVITTQERRGMEPKPDNAPIMQDATPAKVPTSKALRRAKSPRISILKTFERPERVSRAAEGNKIIRNSGDVISYSWTDARHPTIVVPGFPPIWTRQQLPLELPQIPIGTPHSMRMHPLLPVLAAASCRLGGEGKKQFSFKKLDLVTDQIILARLASWAAGTTVDTSGFSYDVQCAGRTVILSRRNGEITAPSDARAQSKRVQLAMTSQVERLTGYHRVVTYSLGGVRLLVQCETNACVLDKDDRYKATALEWGKNHERLIAEAGQSTSPGNLRVISDGMIITQRRSMNLQARREGDDNLTPQEWFMVVMHMTLSQTRHHVLGVHDQSAVRRISQSTLVNLRNQHDNAALGSNRRLRMLKTLLPKLCATIRKQARGKPMRLVCKGGVLTLQTREAGPAIPKHFLKMFH